MKDIDPNPKKKGHYKRECHKLMSEIWGDSKEGRRSAYTWLFYSFGRDIHFSMLDDETLLKEVWERMWKMSFEPASPKRWGYRKKIKKKVAVVSKPVSKPK